MTLTQVLQKIHVLYQGDVDYPASTDDDYTTRVALVNAAIDNWEFEGDGKWKELYATLASAATGTKTTTAGTATYDAPDDFKFIFGFIRVDDENGIEVKYPVISLDRAHLMGSDDVTKRSFVTGNTQDGFTVNIYPTPSVSSRDIQYEYYKTADQMSTGSDILEMSDPFYAVYYALSVLFENDGEGDRASKALQQATDRMDQMKLRNVMSGAYQDSALPDSDYDLGVSGFGI